MFQVLGTTDNRLVIRAISEQGVIEGYICIWGSPDQPDAYGTWFDKNRPPQMDLGFVPFPLRYGHGMDNEIGKQAIGKVTQIWPDENGIKFRAELDANSPFYRRIADEIKSGKLATSSGSVNYLVEFNEDGSFKNWPLAELSLTDKPAETRMPKVAVIRSTDGIQVQISAHEAGTQARPAQSDTSASVSPLKTEIRSKKMLTLDALGIQPGATLEEVIKALIDMLGPTAADAYLDSVMCVPNDPPDPMDDSQPAMESMTVPAEQPATIGRSATVASLMQKLTATAAPVPARQVGNTMDVKTELQALRQQIQALMAAPAIDAPIPPSGHGRKAGGQDNRIKITDVRDAKYDYVSARDLAFAHQVLSQRAKGGGEISGQFMKALAYKIAQAMGRDEGAAADYAVRTVFPYRNPDDVMASAFASYRANEVMGDGNTNKGSDWPGVYYESDLWLVIRQSPIWREMLARGVTERQAPRGYKSDVIPLESTDPTWYNAAETSAVDSTNRPTIGITPSPAGTNSATLSFGKIGALIFYSGELDEDSIIPMAAELRRKMEITAQEKIEYVLLNGDTATGANTNINLIDGTPSATTLYTVLNGMLKVPLVTTTANSRDGGSLDSSDYRLLMSLLGTNGIAGNDPRKLMYIVDPKTKIASLDLPEVKTRDVYDAPTISTGEINQIYGIPIFASGQMALANTAGKISATPGNNTKGRILLIRPDQWVVGFKRQVTMETVRYAEADTNGIVTFIRLGLVNRDATACAAVSYNLTV